MGHGVSGGELHTCSTSGAEQKTETASTHLHSKQGGKALSDLLYFCSSWTQAGREGKR